MTPDPALPPEDAVVLLAEALHTRTVCPMATFSTTPSATCFHEEDARAMLAASPRLRAALAGPPAPPPVSNSIYSSWVPLDDARVGAAPPEPRGRDNPQPPQGMYHPDPAIDAEVHEDAIASEAIDIKAGYPPRWWVCPNCGATHRRGWFQAIGEHRCMGCGYSGNGGTMHTNDPRVGAAPPEPPEIAPHPFRLTDDLDAGPTWPGEPCADCGDPHAPPEPPAPFVASGTVLHPGDSVRIGHDGTGSQSIRLRVEPHLHDPKVRERLADEFMDLRLHGPWTDPEGLTTYQEAARHYADRFLAALRSEEPPLAEVDDGWQERGSDEGEP